MPDSRFVNAQVDGRLFLVCTVAAVMLCVLSGPFGTSVLPFPTRTLLWTALIAFNALKWWAWYRWLAPRVPEGPWQNLAFAGVGALLLNATLPLEIAWIYRAVGLSFAPDWLGLWLVAVAISLSISAVVIVAAHRSNGAAAGPSIPTPASLEQPALPPRGLAAKTDLSMLLAVTSEDHYLRLHLRNGEKPLLLYRFGDALADLAPFGGQQVHRGAWVAEGAVVGASREGRRWWLRLPDGTRLPVSDRHLPAIRARGWLERHP